MTTATLDCEKLLPPNVLSKATLRGKEYAWPTDSVEEAIEAARKCGLANIGGEVQFRIPNGTCELYWMGFDSESQAEGETWRAYVDRSADEVLNRVRQLRSQDDFVNEGVQTFKVLEKMHKEGVDLHQYLCFVLYFDEEQK